MISKCINNDIKIYPVPYPWVSAMGQRNPTCQIHIENKGRVEVLDEIYKQDYKMYDIIDKLYIQLYNDNFN
jgi:hypothetical protein